MTAGLYLVVDHIGKINTRLSPASERLKEGNECPVNTRRTAIDSNSSDYWTKDGALSVCTRGEAKQFVFCVDVLTRYIGECPDVGAIEYAPNPPVAPQAPSSSSSSSSAPNAPTSAVSNASIAIANLYLAVTFGGLWLTM
jgi:hypothetical protein